jgi:hypothetical protein
MQYNVERDPYAYLREGVSYANHQPADATYRMDAIRPGFHRRLPAIDPSTAGRDHQHPDSAGWSKTPSTPTRMETRVSPIWGPAFRHTRSVLPMAQCPDQSHHSEHRHRRISSHRRRYCRSNQEVWRLHTHSPPHHPVVPADTAGSAGDRGANRSNDQSGMILPQAHPPKSTVESLQVFR